MPEGVITAPIPSGTFLYTKGTKGILVEGTKGILIEGAKGILIEGAKLLPSSARS